MNQDKTQYVVDADGNQKAAVLPVERYEQLLADLHALALMAEKGEIEPIRLAEIKRRLATFPMEKDTVSEKPTLKEGVKREIVEKLDELPLGFLRNVLDYVIEQKRAIPKGVPGKELLRFFGTMSHEEAEEMRKAIEEACERVDLSEW